MTHEMIKTDVIGRVGVIRLDNPNKLNALNPVMGRERSEQMRAWNEDPNIGAIVMTGEGRAFCAGADVGGWQKQYVDENDQPLTEEQNLELRRAAEDGAGWVRFCMDAKPLIAAINGAAIGAGLTSVLPFDIRIASERATFSMRFIRMGIFPELNSTHILPHIVGMGHAMELMLTGKILDAAEADRIGLVNRVVPHEDLMDTALEIADQIAFNPMMHARGVKEVTWQNLDQRDHREVQKLEGIWLDKARKSPEFREAVQAFMDKRTPDFHGSSET